MSLLKQSSPQLKRNMHCLSNLTWNTKHQGSANTQTKDLNFADQGVTSNEHSKSVVLVPFG